MYTRYVRIVLSVTLFICGVVSAHPAQSAELSPAQKKYQTLGFGLFLHFNMATFVDLEWANGYEDPSLFRPAKLDCRQWAEAAEAAGMKYAVLTVKHTGGWCLWDSKHTTHDIAAFRNYKGGRGDIVREFVDAFRARGMKVGFYYCFPGDFSVTPWGRLVPEGKPDLHGLPPEAAGDYAGFIKKQLAELLTDYGPIDLLWIDQYKNKYTYPAWGEIREHIRSIQPNCLIVGNNAHDLSESDVLSYEIPWDPKIQPAEDNTLPAEVCDKLSRGWFWSTLEKPSDVRPAREIVDLLERFNARNSNYLLNVPPDSDGLISGPRLERLKEIGKMRKGGNKRSR